MILKNNLMLQGWGLLGISDITTELWGHKRGSGLGHYGDTPLSREVTQAQLCFIWQTLLDPLSFFICAHSLYDLRAWITSFCPWLPHLCPTAYLLISTGCSMGITHSICLNWIPNHLLENTSPTASQSQLMENMFPLFRPKPWGHPWLFSLIPDIWTLRKSYWFDFQNMSRIWPLSAPSLPLRWSKLLSSLTWIFAVT